MTLALRCIYDLRTKHSRDCQKVIINWQRGESFFKWPPRCSFVMRRSNAHRLASGLALTLRAGDGALRLARDLAHDFLALFFRHVLHQRFVSLLEFWVGIDALHHPLTHPLLAVELAHFIQDDRAFQPVAWHPLEVSPMLGILLDVGVNLRLHF